MVSVKSASFKMWPLLVMVLVVSPVRLLKSRQDCQAWAVYEPQYVDATERMTEHLAGIVAPLLSLPEFPKA